MTVFRLDTDAVSSASDVISSISQAVNNIANDIAGYDVSCEDGFDFATAKSVLVKNAESCAKKMKNTVVVMKDVIASHTLLQENTKFMSLKEFGKMVASGGENVSMINGNTGTSTNSQGSSSFNEGQNASAIEYNGKHSPFGYDIVGMKYNDLTEEEKKSLEGKDITYDENGYAKYNDAYLISCSEDLADVNSEISLKQSDNSVINCYVYSNNSSGIKFVGNDNSNNEFINNISTNTTSGMSSIVKNK